MVYAVAWAPISRADDLKACGFADSKVLSEEKREKLYAELEKEGGFVGYQADVLSAAFISGGHKQMHRQTGANAAKGSVESSICDSPLHIMPA
jgi:ribonuclease HII